eukprot:4430197-Amphidinium_carterae.3
MRLKSNLTCQHLDENALDWSTMPIDCEEYYDGVSGALLDSARVKVARELEIKFLTTLKCVKMFTQGGSHRWTIQACGQRNEEFPSGNERNACRHTSIGEYESA